MAEPQYYVQYQVGGGLNTTIVGPAQIQAGQVTVGGKTYPLAGPAYEAARAAQTQEQQAYVAQASKAQYEQRMEGVTAQLHARREALRQGYSGTFQSDYLQRMAAAPVGSYVPTKKEYEQVKYLTSPTAQWASSKVFEEKASQVERFAPFAGVTQFRGQIVQQAPQLTAFAPQQQIKAGFALPLLSGAEKPFYTPKERTFSVIEGRIMTQHQWKPELQLGKDIFGRSQGQPDIGATYRKDIFGSFYKVNAPQPRASISASQAQSIRMTDTAALLFTPSGAFASTTVLKGASLAFKIPKSFSLPSLPSLPKLGVFRETGISPKYKPSFGYLPKEQQFEIVRSETIKSIRPPKPGLFRETGVSASYKPSFRYLTPAQRAETIQAEAIKTIQTGKPGLFRKTGISESYKPSYSFMPKPQQAEIIRSEFIKGRKPGIELFRPTGKASTFAPQYLHLSQAQRSQALKQTYLASRQTPLRSLISSEKGQLLPLSQRQRLHPQQLKPSLKYPYQESTPVYDYIKAWKPVQAPKPPAYRAANIPIVRYGSTLGQRVRPGHIQATPQLTRPAQKPDSRTLHYPILGTGLMSGQALRTGQLQTQLQIQRQIQTHIQGQRQTSRDIFRDRGRDDIFIRPPVLKFPSFPSTTGRGKGKKSRLGFGKFGVIQPGLTGKQIRMGAIGKNIKIGSIKFVSLNPKRKARKGKGKKR